MALSCRSCWVSFCVEHMEPCAGQRCCSCFERVGSDPGGPRGECRCIQLRCSFWRPSTYGVTMSNSYLQHQEINAPYSATTLHTLQSAAQPWERQRQTWALNLRRVCDSLELGHVTTMGPTYPHVKILQTSPDDGIRSQECFMAYRFQMFLLKICAAGFNQWPYPWAILLYLYVYLQWHEDKRWTQWVHVLVFFVRVAVRNALFHAMALPFLSLLSLCLALWHERFMHSNQV